jgi:uncharacterized protein YidB (DUF937 family)
MDMGLFDQVIGGLMGGSTGGTSPVQHILMGLLTGQQSAGNPNQNAGASAMPGGLQGLLSTLQQAGLGDVVQSWIGNGPNQPVSPDQLHSALGADRVQSMANQAGMAPQDFLSVLSQHLPRAVDGVTPDGQVPDEGSVSV